MQSELKAAPADANENGKADTLVLFLAGNQNWVALLAYFDDTSSEPPFGRGPGYIEVIQCKDCSKKIAAESRSGGLAEASDAQVAEVQAQLPR